MADKKPIRWSVPPGCEDYMGVAAFYRDHEENMRQSFSQPSRSAIRRLPDGTVIQYVMNDVIDFISIQRPQRKRVAGGKAMVWDKEPPYKRDSNGNLLLGDDGKPTWQLGGYNVDSEGRYCVVSVINGTDEFGNMLPATFSIKMDKETTGYSISKNIDNPNSEARLRFKNDALGECTVIAQDGENSISLKVAIKHSYCLITSDYHYVQLDSDFKPTNIIAQYHDKFFHKDSEMQQTGNITIHKIFGPETDKIITGYLDNGDAIYHWRGNVYETVIYAINFIYGGVVVENYNIVTSREYYHYNVVGFTEGTPLTPDPPWEINNVITASGYVPSIYIKPTLYYYINPYDGNSYGNELLEKFACSVSYRFGWQSGYGIEDIGPQVRRYIEEASSSHYPVNNDGYVTNNGADVYSDGDGVSYIADNTTKSYAVATENNSIIELNPLDNSVDVYGKRETLLYDCMYIGF